MGRGKWKLLSIIIASIVLIYLITPKKQTHTPVPDRIPADTSSVVTPSTVLPPDEQPAKKSQPPVRSLPRQQQDTFMPAIPILTPPAQQDSIIIHPPVLQPPVITPAAPVKTDSVPATKKPRGVQGISDSSYKIVPKNNTNSG